MKLLFSSLFLLSFFFTIGQSSEDWTLFRSVEGVKFYKKESDCTPKNIPSQTGILIKIVNTTNSMIVASWDLRIWYNGKEQTSNIKDSENHIVERIQKKSSKEGSCDNPNGNLYIFKKFIVFSGSAEMTNFQFENIQIEKLKK